MRQQQISVRLLLALVTVLFPLGCGVSDPTTKGVVVDAGTRKPIPDAHVIIRSFSGKDVWSPAAEGSWDSGKTDNQGKFAIRKSNTFSWDIFIWKEGYFPQALEGASFQRRVLLTKAERPEQCDIAAMNAWLRHLAGPAKPKREEPDDFPISGRAGASGAQPSKPQPSEFASWDDWFRVYCGRTVIRGIQQWLSDFQTAQSKK